ncbi:hypothetical protein C8J56DRAFT_1059773 [Mycena floridula]|nr:hypothetical protein C8J56DRAFT_1059773 [Mycena floridula]
MGKKRRSKRNGLRCPCQQRRGKPSQERRSNLTALWLRTRVVYRDQKTVTHILQKYPTHFLRHPMNQAKVRETVQSINHRPPRDIPLCDLRTEDVMEICISDALRNALKHDDIPHPSFLFKSFHIISDIVNAEAAALAKAYLATQPKGKIESQRSAQSPSTHCGSWEGSRTLEEGPVITVESRMQKATTITAMDAMLTFMKEKVFRKVNTLLENECPEIWQRALRCDARLRRFLGEDFVKRPALYYGPAFACIAMKSGTSEVIHLDFSDDKRFLTWCIPVGNWKGAYFVIPQLNIKIPIIPGHVYAVLAGVVAHCSTPIEAGERYIFTGFMHRNMLQRADVEFFGSEINVTSITDDM